MARITTLDLGSLGSMLRKARGRHHNPARTPPEVLAIYDEIGRRGDILLGDNPKVSKSRKSKYATDILHFASAATARKIVMNDPAAFGYTAAEAKRIKNICPSASAGCIATCLVGSGQGGIGADVENFKLNTITNARIRRQLLMERNAEAFFTVLMIEIAKHARRWRNQGFKYCVRLNGTSDIAWETIPVTVPKVLANWLAKAYRIRVRAGKHPHIFSVFKNIQFYDYTKVAGRMNSFLAGPGRGWPANYYLTWSLAEGTKNRWMALKVLESRKSTVAVPFDTPPTRRGNKTALPRTLTFRAGGEDFTFPVFDADEDDIRFLDPKRGHGGWIAGLRFKLPTDRTKRSKIEATNFRLVTKGRLDPVIRMTGNVVNPGPGFPRRRRR